MKDKVHWLGHASFRIDGENATVYIDPWKLGAKPPEADLVLITHGHYDHFSADDIAKVAGSHTMLVGPADVTAQYKGASVTIKPGESKTVGGVHIEAVAAYNVGKKFHPKANDWLGYVVTVDGTRYYHTGDSDATDELMGARADVVLVPVGGTYTMTADEAAEAVNAIGPKLAVPMHWGDIVGSDGDARRFAELCDCEVLILTPEN